MAKFKFRLERLLEFRRMQEKWAKDAYSEVLSRKNQVEHEVELLQKKLELGAMSRPCAVDERIALNNYFERLDDSIRAQQVLVKMLEDESEQALKAWHEARKDAEAMEKLKEADYAEWLLEENRREQAELDEWAVLRRAA